MSVVDTLQKLFKRRKADATLDAPMSVAVLDETVADADGGFEAQTVQSAPMQAPASAAGVAASDAGAASAGLINVPLLGTRAVAVHQRILGWLLGLAVLALLALVFVTLRSSAAASAQFAALGQAQVQAQRLAQAATQAIGGTPSAFAELNQSAQQLGSTVRALLQGNDSMNIAALPEALQPLLARSLPQVQALERNAQALEAQQKALVQAGLVLRQMQMQSPGLVQAVDALQNIKLTQGAPLTELASVYQLKVLLLRIGKASLDMTAPVGGATELAQLGRDLQAFQDLSQGLRAGSEALRLAPPRDAATQEQADNLVRQFEPVRVQAAAMGDSAAALASARQAHQALLADSAPVRQQIEALQASLSGQTGVSGAQTSLMLLAAAVALIAAAGLAYVQIQISRQRHTLAEAQRLQAQRLEQDAKRVNDANQAAILRLMNELQSVAEGDLTQEATVTEDITGAIADSVNYTVEELRTLVASVQSTAAKVAQTTADVDANSTELLAASNEQLHEIRETGRSVLDMAGRINAVSAQAQESARVARQSLEAAQTGLTAVQNTMGGMNTIRDQIQETSKRIKRLGESSQEIGEITELISDITEQTNVLALNAAIQAASAGEAGRGFSVVAEEVQRLAERSAAATRQIAALVRAIQGDTQDAIAAMERSTQGVVEGARLSDNAGTALSEIDRVSRRVADLIEQISRAASQEAGLANTVAENIQHIFAVTEQTGEGTRVTAGQVRELSRMAEELRQSVARFKIN